MLSALAQRCNNKKPFFSKSVLANNIITRVYWLQSALWEQGHVAKYFAVWNSYILEIVLCWLLAWESSEIGLYLGQVFASHTDVFELAASSRTKGTVKFSFLLGKRVILCYNWFFIVLKSLLNTIGIILSAVSACLWYLWQWKAVADKEMDPGNVHVKIAPQAIPVLDSLTHIGLNAPLPKDSLFWASSQEVLAQRNFPAHKIGHVVVIAIQARQARVSPCFQNETTLVLFLVCSSSRPGTDYFNTVLTKMGISVLAAAKMILWYDSQ